MLLHGDELGRTQEGNNNAYCQDNPIAWVDWTDARDHWALTDFAERLASLRRDHPVFRRRRFFQGDPARGSESELGDIAWFTPAGEHMNAGDWQVGYARSLAVFLNGDAIAEPDGARREDHRRLVPAVLQRPPRRHGLHRPAGDLRRAVGGGARHRGAAGARPADRQGRRDRSASSRGRSWCCAALSDAGPDRDLPAAAAAGVRLRRGRRGPPLPARPGRVARLPLPRAAGGTRLDTRLRRRRPQPPQRGARRGRGLPPALGRGRVAGHGRRGRRGPQPHGGAHPGVAERRPLVGAADRPGLALRAVVRRRVGRPGARAADAGARAPHRRGGGRRRDHPRPRRRPRRPAGAALLRPRLPGAAGHRGPAAARAAGPAVLPAGALAGR